MAGAAGGHKISFNLWFPNSCLGTGRIDGARGAPYHVTAFPPFLSFPFHPWFLVMLHPGHGEDFHPAGPGLTQDLGALLHGGPGGIEVIDEQHVFALHQGRVGDQKSPFDVVPAFLGVEPTWGTVWRVRTTASRATGASGKARARSRDWLKPRFLMRLGCRGTGASRSAAATNSRQSGA